MQEEAFKIKKKRNGVNRLNGIKYTLFYCLKSGREAEKNTNFGEEIGWITIKLYLQYIIYPLEVGSAA